MIQFERFMNLDCLALAPTGLGVSSTFLLDEVDGELSHSQLIQHLFMTHTWQRFHYDDLHLDVFKCVQPWQECSIIYIRLYTLFQINGFNYNLWKFYCFDIQYQIVNNGHFLSNWQKIVPFTRMMRSRWDETLYLFCHNVVPCRPHNEIRLKPKWCINFIQVQKRSCQVTVK